MITKTWQGYRISKRIRNSDFSLYVKSIYKGKITWTTDFTYAKYYSEKTAKRIDAEVEEALLNGTFDNERIVADAEIKPEAAEPEAEEAEAGDRSEFFWNDEVKRIDRAMNLALEYIAKCSHSEKEDERVAVQFFKDEYIRLSEKRTKAAKEWLETW